MRVGLVSRETPDMSVFSTVSQSGLAGKRSNAPSARKNARWRGRVEQLEERTVLATLGQLAMISATALSPSLVTANYAVTGAPLAVPMTLGIYRSPSSAFDSSSVLVGQTTLQISGLSLGSHQVSVSLAQPLDINPAEKFVLAVADPSNQTGQTSQATDVTSFRTWIVGAVTHGLEFDRVFPSWVSSVAAGLKVDGYDAAIAFNWAQLSMVAAAGTAAEAAQEMAVQIDQAIASLPIQPGDVVDVHLIGHSRGGDVVTLAAGLLNRSVPPLAGGFIELTLLDPHPARDGPVAYYSSSTGPIGALARQEFVAFQAATNDPPLVIPLGVNETQIFYQQTAVTAAFFPDERFLILWGEVPAAGATQNVVYYNISGLVPSHEGIPDYYLGDVVPLLATAAPPPLAPSPTPPYPTNGGPVFAGERRGLQYEYGLFKAAGVPSPIASQLLRGYSALNLMLKRRRFLAAGAQINRMDRFVGKQSGRTIPAAAVPILQEQLQLARVFLFPAASASVKAGLANSGRHG
jgi:hypothetical protein